MTENTAPGNAIATGIIAVHLGRLTTVEYASMKQCADAIVRNFNAAIT